MTPLHGSPEGYDLGCTKDTECPAFEITGMSCETTHIRFVTGERRYMQLRGRGLDPKQIAARLGFTPEKSRERVEAEKVRREEGNVEEQEAVVVISNRATGRLPDGVTRADVRAWAREHGIECNDRGNLPKAVMEAHKAAHPALWGVVKTAAESASSKVPVLSPAEQEAVLTAIVHAPVVPDMETRAELFNEGFDEAAAQYGPVIDDLARTEGALELVLTKWNAERQRRLDAEKLVFALSTEVASLTEQLRSDPTSFEAVAAALWKKPEPDERGGGVVISTDTEYRIEARIMPALRGAHAAALKPWWKRWVS